MPHEVGDQAYGIGAGWEHIGEDESLPRVERAGRFGYHRAFYQQNGNRTWFFAIKSPDGTWVPAHEDRFASVGEITEDGPDMLRAEILRKDERGRIVEDEISLPRLEELVSEEPATDAVGN